jgi:hypothetical protein
MTQCDYVGGGFLDDGVTGDFQGSKDRGFPASRSTGEDVSFHIKRCERDRRATRTHACEHVLSEFWLEFVRVYRMLVAEPDRS